MNTENVTKKYEIWDKLIENFSRLKLLADSAAKSNPDFLIESIFFEITVDYYQRLYRAEANQVPIMMCNPGIPLEFFYSANIFPLVLEMASIPLAGTSTEDHLKYIDHAEESGLTREHCNNIKIWIGAMLQGLTPKPDMIIYADFPCDSTTILWQIIRDHYKVPSFAFDVPYWHYDTKNEYYDDETLPYYVKQFREMMKSIEMNVGVKITIEKLTKTLEHSNQLRSYILEIMELLKTKPNPLNSEISYAVYSSLITSAGLPGKPIEFVRRVRDKAARNVKNKVSAISERHNGKEEKYRCFWACMPVYFDLFLFTWMEQKFGVSTVMNMMGNQLTQLVNTSSEESILTDLAKNILNIPMGRQLRGPLEFLLDDIINAVNEYQVDLCIWGGHVGCKQSWGIANLVKRMVEEQTGVPTLIFQVDDLDGRIVSSRTIKKSIRDFIRNILDG